MINKKIINKYSGYIIILNPTGYKSLSEDNDIVFHSVKAYLFGNLT